MAVASAIPSTSTGTEELVSVPLPSCPELLLPQQDMVPSSWSAQECAEPALTDKAAFSGFVVSGKDGELSALSLSVLWFLNGSGCELCGVSAIDLAEVVVLFSVLVLSELRTVSEAAGWFWGVLGFSVFVLSESLAQLAASRAVSASRQKVRKSRRDSRFIST